MSSGKCAVYGLGFKMDDLELDAIKIYLLFGKFYEEAHGSNLYADKVASLYYKECVEDFDFPSVSEAIEDETGCRPCLVSDGETEYYIHQPLFSWEVSSRSKGTTEATLKDIMCKELSKITKQSEGELLELFSLVNTGCN